MFPVQVISVASDSYCVHSGPLKKDWALVVLPVLQVVGARWGPFCPMSFGVGGRCSCIVPYGMAVAAARMGPIVLRLCRTSTPPANPPVGGCMPVNYCTLGEKNEKKEKREREMRSTGRRRRRTGKGGGGVRDREAPLAVIMKWSVTD